MARRQTRGEDVPAIRIEPETGWAWRGNERLDLAPKAFAVLRHLIEHPQHLITKDEILAAAWGETVVSEAALTSCIRDLRKALDDSSRAPRYIETVHRRGFRFIGPVGAAVPPPTPAPRSGPPTMAPSPPVLVGRDAEIARLHALFATASSGERRVVFVTGEAGIGKTTLIEAFLARLGDADALRIGRGQCVEQYGASEAYLPVLEAIGRMGREPRGDALVGILKQYAPTWLAQLPALLSDDDLAAVQRRAQGTTRERMLRELSEALDAVSMDVPLVLVLEDLHWSDAATIDLVTMLARRRDPARLLVLGTYRPADVAAHPLKSAKHELQIHGQCEEIALDFLSEGAVGAYLAGRFPRAAFPERFARVLHDNTGGNPLFLVNAVDDLVARGDLRRADGEWTLAVPVERVAAGVPQTLWQMVEKQVERLTPEEQSMLAIGSVAGAEFSAALSVVDGIDAHDGERICEALARRGLFVRADGVAEWPDGTVAERYGFIHALYRNVLYARVSIGHRVGLHLRIGARLEGAHASRAADIAGELAMHFEHGRDFERAVHYRRQAAEAALRQHAYREAVIHATNAVALLATLPESPQRNEQELMVQTRLGAAVIATNGWAAPEVARAYARARDLCSASGLTPQLLPVLVGLCGFYLMRGDLRIAQETDEQLLALAEPVGDPGFLVSAHGMVGLRLFYGGRFNEALGHLERGWSHYDPTQSVVHLQGLSVDHDSGVSCSAHAALALMMLGYQERAAVRMQECLTLARSIDHPLSVAMASNFAAMFHLARREPQIVQELEVLRREYSTKHDFELFLLLGEIYRGWLLTQQGHREEGATRIRQGLAVYKAIGAELGQPTFLGILAEACHQLDRRDEARAAIAEALSLGERTGMHYWDAELHRLLGMLAQHDGLQEQAEASFLAAIELARRQEARFMELRAAMCLGRLWQGQGRNREAHELVSGVYGWFTEGLDTADLRDAQALLGSLTLP